ncbi:Hint domain-containing protein [Marivita hallyeonensis]|uniref:Hint domain-containing protein n=1 Tax=Marivita hallyeonensis TaxID=996342 RepID=A0A1M5URS4_9RHOB|nr:Hint domain-containing protein [Marivita hallyeonensis]SHH65767.1 Hint domain-containing protein [Marivita hallyeonensis]
MATGAELTYTTNASATAMAEAIFGDGVTVVNASYTGDNRSSAIYENGDALAPGVTPGDTGVILSTGRATRFTQSGGDPNRSASTTSGSNGPNNNADFNAAAGASTFDASFLDVDFIPDADTMTMRFVFSSEEYPEFTNSVYQDFVGVWVNGQQVNILPGNGDIDPANLNDTQNSNLFIDNMGDDYNTEMDGFTVTLTLTMNVIPDQVNSIRIGIADVVDSSYDSNLLIAGDSIQTTLVAQADTVSLFTNTTKTLDVLANDINNTAGSLVITHINGIAVTAGDSVTLNTGQTVTLNADGTLSVTSDGDFETVNFTYEVESSSGGVDVGFVTIATVPCFVAGTRIQCEHGHVRVEDLRPGDMVWTMDRGLQPLRWIGQRTVAALGSFAPVQVKAGTFGDHTSLQLSPQHRILLRDPVADLVFGTPEVLVAAKHLVNGTSVLLKEGGSVTYVHLLFDQHEIVMANGLATESFLPGPQTVDVFEDDTAAEIAQLFPDLDLETGEGYGDAARQILKKHEVKLLLGAAA